MPTIYSRSGEDVSIFYSGYVINNDVVIQGSLSGKKIEYYSDGRIKEHNFRLVIPKQAVDQLCVDFQISWSPEAFFNEVSKRFGGEFLCGALSDHLNKLGLKHKYDMSSSG